MAATSTYQDTRSPSGYPFPILSSLLEDNRVAIRTSVFRYGTLLFVVLFLYNDIMGAMTKISKTVTMVHIETRHTTAGVPDDSIMTSSGSRITKNSGVTIDGDDARSATASKRAVASLAFRKHQFEVAQQPEIYGQTFLATPAYQTNGGNLTFVEYLEQNGIGPSEDAWKSWSASRSAITRPPGTVVKLLLLTKDEGSILKQWIVYHGEIVGYENLYVLDGSIQPDSISFLADVARDQWGVNVIFSPSNLNELQVDLQFVGRAVAKAADVVIKMDTDEFLALHTGDRHCSAFAGVSDHDDGNSGIGNSSHAGNNAVDCGLSPYGLSAYLLRGTSSDLHGRHLTTGHLMDSAHFPHSCNSQPIGDEECEEEGVMDDLGRSAFDCVYNKDGGGYKQAQDVRISVSANLGGHIVHAGDNVSPYVGDVTSSPFGILHFHSRCNSLVAANSRKAMIGHGMIEETDTPDMVREKYQKLLPPDVAQDICGKLDVPAVGNIPGHHSSVHKVVNYLQYIHGCSQSAAVPTARGPTNPEFAQFLEDFVVRYAKM